MDIAMSNTLALMSWREFRLFLGDFADGGFILLLIGFLLAIVALSAFATEAALVMHTAHRRRSSASWPVDPSESRIPEETAEGMME
jgi:hypothetical protein